jgi:hypothetical protein
MSGIEDDPRFKKHNPPPGFDTHDPLKWIRTEPPRKGKATFVIVTLTAAALAIAICYGGNAIDGRIPDPVSPEPDPSNGGR